MVQRTPFGENTDLPKWVQEEWRPHAGAGGANHRAARGSRRHRRRRGGQPPAPVPLHPHGHVQAPTALMAEPGKNGLKWQKWPKMAKMA